MMASSFGIAISFASAVILKDSFFKLLHCADRMLSGVTKKVWNKQLSFHNMPSGLDQDLDGAEGRFRGITITARKKLDFFKEMFMKKFGIPMFNQAA